MYGYIYLTTNLVNGKMYVGKHAGHFNENYKGSGKVLWRAINKYGWDNFKVELLKECDSKEELSQSEIEEISLRDASNSPMYYNISCGGEGWNMWGNKEYRDHMSSMMTGDNNPTKRQEVRDKMSKNHADFTGKNNPNYGGLTEKNLTSLRKYFKERDYYGEKNPMYGKRHSEESISKMSRAKVGNTYVKGYISITNGVVNKRVPPDKLEEWVSQGFYRGVTKKNK